MNPLDLYGVALQGGTTLLRYADGRQASLDVRRWTSVEAPGDDALLARCGSATLDVGCGPGRLARALLTAGIVCVGVDVAPTAVEIARSRGAEVLHASVHDPLLDDTRWSTVLLADGNIGIGGDPVALLQRAHRLLAPGGRVVVELDPPSTRTSRVQVRLEADGQASSWFAWAHVGALDVAPLAWAAGLEQVESWTAGGRHFASLTPSDAELEVA